MKAGGAMSVADLPVALRNRGRSRGENKCVNIVPPWLRFRGGPIEIAVTTTDREARDDLTARRENAHSLGPRTRRLISWYLIARRARPGSPSRVTPSRRR